MKKICLLVSIILGVSAQVKAYRAWSAKCSFENNKDRIVTFSPWRTKNQCDACNDACGNKSDPITRRCLGYKKGYHPSVEDYDNSAELEHLCS